MKPIIRPEVEKIEYKTIELTNADQESTWSAVWSKVLVNVPVYEYNDANENGIQDAGEKITAYYVTRRRKSTYRRGIPSAT